MPIPFRRGNTPTCRSESELLDFSQLVAKQGSQRRIAVRLECRGCRENFARRPRVEALADLGRLQNSGDRSRPPVRNDDQAVSKSLARCFLSVIEWSCGSCRGPRLDRVPVVPGAIEHPCVRVTARLRFQCLAANKNEKGMR
jgi:hypothetical protein